MMALDEFVVREPLVKRDTMEARRTSSATRRKCNTGNATREMQHGTTLKGRPVDVILHQMFAFVLARVFPLYAVRFDVTRSVTSNHSLTIAISTRRDSFFEDFGISGPKDEYSILEVATPFEVMYSPTLNARSKPR